MLPSILIHVEEKGKINERMRGASQLPVQVKHQGVINADIFILPAFRRC
jgi:hypothetical protein